ncbi:MAG: hypothetical protein U0235_25810 [Polyangiaceae bacterium]
MWSTIVAGMLAERLRVGEEIVVEALPPCAKLGDASLETRELRRAWR